MATKRPAKPRQTLLEEASDPTTDSERLRHLADHEDEVVHRAAWKNPSLPEEAWRKALMQGYPEVWDNPMAPFYLLTWTPRQEEAWNTLEWPARWVTIALWKDPERCSTEAKALIAAKVQEGWATSEDADIMMIFLGQWAQAKGDGSPEHREVVHILVRCVRTAPGLSAKDRQALDLLEAWCAGGKDRRKKAKTLASSEYGKGAVRFAQDSLSSPWHPIYEVLGTVDGTLGTQAKAEHKRLMADIIRQEMPLPPVVD